MKTAKAHNQQFLGYYELYPDKSIGPPRELTAKETINVLRGLDSNLRVIEWKPYPKNKPPKKDDGRDFLLTIEGGSLVCGTWFQNGRGVWDFDYSSVIAFAELPAPFQEEKR